MTISERWKREIWPECRAILAVAFGLSLTLWTKRSVERMFHKKIISKEVFEHGLKPKQPMTPSIAVPARRMSFDNFRPKKPFREGGGQKWIYDLQTNVVYRRKWNMDDGVEIYDHDEILHAGHTEGPCPLLITDKGCHDCQYFTWHPKHEWASRCAAKIWIEECENQTMSLDFVRDSMM